MEWREAAAAVSIILELIGHNENWARRGNDWVRKKGGKEGEKFVFVCNCC